MKNLFLILALPFRLEQAIESARKAAPSLMALRRRGTTLHGEPSLLETCCQALGIEKQRDWPVAPLTALSDGLEPEKAYWLRLDPAHLEVGMGGLMLRPARELALAETETRALVGSLNVHWRQQGFEILAPTPTRWYVRLPATPDFASTPLDQVIGEYLSRHLPSGGDASRLMNQVNEAQMLMHDHPVNQARESHGRPVVNGLWLWGGGILATPAPTIDRVASDEADVRSMAKAAGIRAEPSPVKLGALDEPSRISNALVTLSPNQEDFGLDEYLARLERDWFKPLLRDLAYGRIRHLRLDLLTRPGQSISIRPDQAWRFWR